VGFINSIALQICGIRRNENHDGLEPNDPTAANASPPSRPLSLIGARFFGAVGVTMAISFTHRAW
jgi:hypothetical protein